MNRILTAICCLLYSIGLAAQPGTARGQLEQFSSGLESLAADFNQQVIGADNKVQDASAGKVWLQRPGRFRWEYGGDFPEVVVADGERIWIYDEMLEQVTVKDQAQAEVNSPLALLTDISRLDEQFEVREQGEADDLVLLELRGRNTEAEFERVLLGFREKTLALMIMEDAFGLRTEIQFKNVQRNLPVEPGLFEFDPPPGADVIGDLTVLPDGS